MKVVIRVDSSNLIGSGHVMRSITLAKRFKYRQNADVHFISRELEGNLSYLAENAGFALHKLPRYEKDTKLAGYAEWLSVDKDTDARETIEILRSLGDVDTLVVDSYALDIDWEKQMRPFVRKIFVIDDLANRRHEADILLDQNFYIGKDNRYNGLVPKTCRMLLGPKHALLRDEFYEERKTVKDREGQINNILVFYGGSDLTNETMKALKALVNISPENVVVNVVVGGGNNHKNDVEKFCAEYDFLRYYCQIDNMAKFMSEADLALGAGGSSTWERLYLKLPCIVTAIADNQIKISKDCAKVGYIDYIGTYDEVSEELLQEKIKGYLVSGIVPSNWNFNIEWE